MEDYKSVLKNEFEAGEDSFLITLRIKLEWNKAAFNRLASAMKRCAEEKSDDHQLERSVAWGFWFVPRFTKDWVAHPDFPKIHSAEYYNKALTRLYDLADWYFSGRSPYESGSRFEDLV